MTLELSALHELLAGRRDPLWVGSIPYRICTIIGCSTGAVYLSKSTAEHILQSPKSIDPFTLLMIPVVIQRGQFMREIERQNCLNVIYPDGESRRDYFLALKIASSGHELWVSSFYPLKARQKNAKLKRNRII